MGLVETAMSTRGSLVVFEPENVAKSELKLSGKFVELLATYAVCVKRVKNTEFDEMVTTAQKNMSKVTGVLGKLLHEIDVYQNKTKPALVNKIQETEKAITNTETKLNALKKGEKIKDDKGNEVEVKPEDKKKLEALVKYLKANLKQSTTEFDKIKKSVAPIKKMLKKEFGVATETTLANMVCSSKGTGAVGSLFEVGNFITGAIKSGKTPKDKEVDTMMNKLTDETIEKGHVSSYANIAALAARTADDEKNKPNSFGIDFSVISNDIEAVTSVCKGSIQELVKAGNISEESIEKLKEKTKKNFDTIADNCKAYCANSGLKGKEQKALIDLCKGICGLMVLNAWTALLKEFDNAYSGSGGSGVSLSVWGGILLIVGCALVVSFLAVMIVSWGSVGLLIGLAAGALVSGGGGGVLCAKGGDIILAEKAEADRRWERLCTYRNIWARWAIYFSKDDIGRDKRFNWDDALWYASREWTDSRAGYSEDEVKESAFAWWRREYRKWRRRQN